MSGIATQSGTLSAPIKAKLDAAREAAATSGAQFRAKRAEILESGADISDPDGDAFKAIEPLHAAKLTADQQVASLSDALYKAMQMDGVRPDDGDVERSPQRMADGLRAARSGDIRDMAERIMATDEYKEIREVAARQSKSGWGGQRSIGEAATRQEFFNLVTGAAVTSGGAFVTPDRAAGFTPLAQRKISLRNLVTVLTTDSDIVEFVRQTLAPTSAAIVPEATSVAPGDEDGLKPTGEIEFEVVPESVKNIAEIIPVTRRAFADVGQLRGIIEGALRDDHLRVLENEMVEGTGGNTHLTGLLNVSGLNEYDATDNSENDLTAIRRALTLIQLDNEDDPNAVLVNPADAERQDLYRTLPDGTGTGEYLSPDAPYSTGVRTIWGLPRIVTNVCPENMAIVGNFRRATLHLRGGIELLASDSHKDWFARNVIALLCEGRYAFTVERPASFAAVTLDPSVTLD